ncbi:glycosyl transferase [Cupriavidus gilardii]|uniref:glycosyl transferase n=1 Tax=Cupriavidus gilardii TaxID=82541 RepID=UPI00157253F8|nr:glycosyl transferase [Cupriavidus gilardii]NSX04482.1 glycosyl transferase [Cupriavidus gilardii]
MTNLVYLSPVPWSSFSQRSHKFVEWWHMRQGGAVLWVEPYPTRLPNLGDVRRLRGKNGGGAQQLAVPDWIHVVRPSALPIEPLPFSRWLNRPLWQALMAAVEQFCKRGQAVLAVGKPSQLALELLSRPWFGATVFDSMDHFSAFYRGLSRRVMAGRERQVVMTATAVMASSSALCKQWAPVSRVVLPVFNACDPAVLPPWRNCDGTSRSRAVFGYVGTLGPWFDWRAVLALAHARPDALVRLIGPVFGSVPLVLPSNVEMLPACSHDQAMRAVADFDVGLIPFLRNTLTESVDPIKYYEYRAMGLPVLSTGFGEMRQRTGEQGVFLADSPDQIRRASEQALDWKEPWEAALDFRQQNSWSERFDRSGVAELLGVPSRV